MNFKKFFPQVFSTNYMPNTPHAILMKAILRMLSTASSDIDALYAELCILTASGHWLDEWGSWFGVRRNGDESDEEFRPRILAAIHAPKSTISALKKTTCDYINSTHNKTIYKPEDIGIFEPYSKIKSFSSRGEFDGDCHFPDGDYWRRDVVDIELPENPDENLFKLIRSTKAAGIKVMYTLKSNSGLYTSFTGSDQKVYTDKSLIIELPMYKTLEGLIRSVYTPHNVRTRSGRQTLFGIDSKVLIEGELTRAMRLAGDSWIYQHMYKNETPVAHEYEFPSQNPARFNISRGVFSDIHVPYVEYSKPDKLEDDAPVDLLMPVDRFATKYRPQMFSRSFCGYDCGFPLSGVFGDGIEDHWNGKEPQRNISYYFNSSFMTPVKNMVSLITELRIDKKKLSNKYSGNRVLWEDKQISWDLPQVFTGRYADESYLIKLLEKEQNVEPVYVPISSKGLELSQNQGSLSGTGVLTYQTIVASDLPEGHIKTDATTPVYRLHASVKPLTMSDVVGGHSTGNAHSGLYHEHYVSPTKKEVVLQTYVEQTELLDNIDESVVITELGMAKYPRHIRPTRSGMQTLWFDHLICRGDVFDLSKQNLLLSPAVKMEDLNKYQLDLIEQIEPLVFQSTTVIQGDNDK